MSDWTNKLYLYIDGELDENERAEVEHKLQTWPALRAEYDNLLVMLASLNDMHDEEPPADLYKKMMQAAKPKRTIFTYAKRFGAAAAALLVLAFYGIFVHNTLIPRNAEPEHFAAEAEMQMEMAMGDEAPWSSRIEDADIFDVDEQIDLRATQAEADFNMAMPAPVAAGGGAMLLTHYVPSFEEALEMIYNMP
ncbi:MAG: hypothetical protein FWC67_04865, partial [Defluviitaleaceae bacterium]|nr:hypothetical protein [Defluviitaleaceae bacterium]